MSKYLVLITVTLMLTIAIARDVNAQQTRQRSQSHQSVVKSKPTNCEDNIAVLDAASNIVGNDGLIIAIAHLGEGETKLNLNKRRLENIKTYLTLFMKRDSASIILAEGEPTEGTGQIRLYVKGELFRSIVPFRNLDLAVGQCSFEGVERCSIPSERGFYPCRK